MWRLIGSLSIAAEVLLASAQMSSAQGMSRSGSVLVPQSSVEHPEDTGVRFHANIVFKVIHGSPEQELPRLDLGAASTPPFPFFAYETPASLGCVYRLVSTIVPGCNPNTATENPTGGSRTVAIVDAYDDPDAMRD